MFFENVSLCESFMKNTDLAGAIQADLRCVKADIVLYGKSYEKDCSLLAILSELREREETKVAGVLFS